MRHRRACVFSDGSDEEVGQIINWIPTGDAFVSGMKRSANEAGMTHLTRKLLLVSHIGPSVELVLRFPWYASDLQLQNGRVSDTYNSNVKAPLPRRQNLTRDLGNTLMANTRSRPADLPLKDYTRKSC